MESVNEVKLAGRLGQDPTLKTFTNGGCVCNISVATTSEYTTKTGEKKEVTDWHRVCFFGTLGEQASTVLRKGDWVSLTGRQKTRSWETPEGDKRYITEVHSEDVVFPKPHVGGSSFSESEIPF